MLVLGRKVSEQIVFAGEGITLTVEAIEFDSVQLSVNVERHVPHPAISILGIDDIDSEWNGDVHELVDFCFQCRVKQLVKIGGQITISVEKIIGRNKVRLGLEAPDSIKILRAELSKTAS